MTISKPQFENTIVAITELLEGSGPADARLSAYFRDNRKLGVHDRAFIAEAVYTILRRRRFLEYLAPDASPRRLLLACLVRLNGISPRELEPFLRKPEIEWLHELKAKSADNLSLPVQAELPDWLWEKLSAQYGEEQALTLARSLQQTAPLDLRVNRLSGQREAVLALFAKESIVARPPPIRRTACD
jgi:tRNA and rRNA cytosine-C5-methylases